MIIDNTFLVKGLYPPITFWKIRGYQPQLLYEWDSLIKHIIPNRYVLLDS